MEILINDKEVDFTLETEKNIGDVYSGIEEYLSNEGYVITQIKMDDEVLDLETKSWDSASIDTIANFSVTAQSPAEIQIQAIETLIEYFSGLRECVESENSSTIQKLISEAPIIHEHLSLVLNDSKSGAPNSAAEIYCSLLNDSEFIKDRSINREHGLRVLTFINNITMILKERLEEINSPVSAFLSAIRVANAMIEELTQISIMLQTGKDHDAMRLIVRFTELIQKILRTLQYLERIGYINFSKDTIGEESIKNFCIELKKTLSELFDGFSNNDMVLIGDIVEYEVVPKLENLSEFADTLK